MPVRIGCPNPPAPISAPKVAVPTLMTADVWMPARIEGEASGSSTFYSRAMDDRPSTSADSRSDPGMPASPDTVFLTIGRTL